VIFLVRTLKARETTRVVARSYRALKNVEYEDEEGFVG
jgi:hypothetical protein